MRSHQLGLILLLSLTALSASGRAPSSSSFDDIAFDRLLILDAERAGERIVAVGERGYTPYSDDNGKTWTITAAPVVATLTAVHFVNNEVGVAVGHDAVILRSIDAGRSWSKVFSAPDQEAPLLDIWFADAQHGFAVGAYGSFYETHDGGNSWQQRKVLQSDMHINAITGGADGILYLAGEAGTIYRSADRGASWQALKSPYRGSFFGVLRLPNDAVLVFGLRGRIYRSSDAGRNWQQISAPAQASLMGGRTLNDGSIVLLGHDGTVLLSRDQGRSFQRQASNTRKALIAALRVSDQELLLFGEPEPGSARASLEFKNF